MVNCSIVGWFESLTKKDELKKDSFQEYILRVWLWFLASLFF